MFLYLFEDDNFRQTNEMPTEHDRTCVAAGILAVFRYTTGNGYERLFVDEDKAFWIPIAHAKVANDFPEAGPYHV